MKPTLGPIESLIHLKDLTIVEDRNHLCFAGILVGGGISLTCLRSSAMDVEYTLNGERRGFFLCADCCRAFLLPHLPADQAAAEFFTKLQ